jgi:6-pyruvoyltetrahydropterin/6-carboxytetrahydropterin synthase
MIIRKKYEVESAHIVRNCTSNRCSHSIHGHSAVIEVFLESTHLDNAQMVYDFGLMKGTIKQFIDSMDHCYLLCSHDDEKFRNFIKETCDRWIELPFNPSAEMLSVFIFNFVRKILECTQTNNGEGNIQVKSVRYHETTTGYAECDINDWDRFYNQHYSDITFSNGVVRDWSNELLDLLINSTVVQNPIIEQQIDLNPVVKLSEAEKLGEVVEEVIEEVVEE